MEAEIFKILESASNKSLAQAILDSFKEVEKQFYLKKWKSSELDAGHFVEAVRRFLDLRLFGAALPIGKTLNNFDATELKRYESATSKSPPDYNDSYRIHIPRVLYSAYSIRNKRGIAHLSLISPNRLDATFVLSSCKWVLAEIVRVESGRPAEETTGMVDKVVQRNIEGVWEEDGIRRLLLPNLGLREKVLVVLLDRSPQSISELANVIRTTDLTYLRNVIRKLDKAALIHFEESKDRCTISPTGRISAEQTLAQ